MPTETRPATDPQNDFLTAVRESQAAVVDTIRTWTTVGQQLTGVLRLPAPDVDLAGIVDLAFDVAEQTLAVQRQLARTLVGVASRQLDTAVRTADTTVEAAQTAAAERADRVGDLVEAAEAETEQRERERPEQRQAADDDAGKGEKGQQDRKPDRRTYEERSVEELRERAAELQIEGRSAMNKEDLIAALRKHNR